MKMWEIVKGMTEEKYTTDQIFQNADLGDMIINDELELVWINTLEPVVMLVGDDIDWEAL